MPRCWLSWTTSRAVDDDVRDPDRVTSGPGERVLGCERGEVEHGEIGVRPHFDAPAPAQCEAVRDHRGHLPHRLLEGERAGPEDVVGDVVGVAGEEERVARTFGEGSVGATGEPVDAEAEQRVGDRLGDVFGGEQSTHQLDGVHVRPSGLEHIEERVPAVLSPSFGDLRERKALEFRCRRTDRQDDAVPLALVHEPPVAVAVAAQPGADLGVAQEPRGLGGPVGKQPCRQQAGGEADAVRVGGHVGEHVEPGLALGGESVDGALPGVRGCAGVVANVEVRQLCAEPVVPRDGEELVHGVEEMGVPVADVAGVDAVVPGERRADTAELIGGRVTPGAVFQAARHPERPGVHRLLEVADHPGDAFGVGAGTAYLGCITQSRVPDEPRQVLGRSCALAMDDVEQVCEAAPRDLSVVPVRVQRVAGCADAGRGDGGVGDAAVADDLGRHALADGALGVTVAEDRPVAVAVRVDEPGDDRQSRDIDALSRLGAQAAHDGDYPAIIDRDVGHLRRGACAVDEVPAEQEEVDGGGGGRGHPLRRCGRDLAGYAAWVFDPLLGWCP